MSLIQLPVRWSDMKKPSEDETEFLRRIIDGEESGQGIEFVYGSVVLDTKDIRAYNDLDERHCILRTYQSDSYCVALGLEELKQVMTEMTGSNITIIRRVESKEVKKPRGGGKKKEDDDLLL